MTVRSILHCFFFSASVSQAVQTERSEGFLVQNTNRILHRGLGGNSLPQQAVSGAHNQNANFGCVRTLALLARIAKPHEKLSQAMA